MAQAKKKRNKKYSGKDAAVTRTKVTKVSVPDRSAGGKWWHENRQKIRRRLIVLGVILISYGVISWLVNLIF